MNALLTTVMAIAISLQIAYPLLDGEALRVVTIAVVYWGAGAMVLHAALAYGTRYAFTYISFTFLTVHTLHELRESYDSVQCYFLINFLFCGL